MDTSAGACSAAVHDDGRIVERLQEMQRGHAEALLPMIVAVMREAGREFRDLDLIAVTVGPGAFTGLRVGLAAARGIALAAALPCFGVTTLEAMADAIDWPTLAGRPALVALDNKQGGVYVQVFEGGRALESPSIESPHALCHRFAATSISVAGDASPMLVAALRAAGADAEEIAVPRHPMASAVGAIAARRWLAGERPPGPPAPIYLRKPATGPSSAKAFAG